MKFLVILESRINWRNYGSSYKCTILQILEVIRRLNASRKITLENENTKVHKSKWRIKIYKP